MTSVGVIEKKVTYHQSRNLQQAMGSERTYTQSVDNNVPVTACRNDEVKAHTLIRNNFI